MRPVLAALFCVLAACDVDGDGLTAVTGVSLSDCSFSIERTGTLLDAAN